MQLLADSGSTKTDWFLYDTNADIYTTPPLGHFESKGMNPVVLATEEIRAILTNAFAASLPLEKRAKIQKLCFYGAGCSKIESGQKMLGILSEFFETAEISVRSDIWAAIHACCPKTAGIVCILGTGANSCVYNGAEIVDNIPSLGYLLGDEGAGFDLGKRILEAYFCRQFPKDLQALFQAQYPDVTETNILPALYQAPAPNRYIAGFAQFAIAQQNQPFIQKIIVESFQNFIQYRILPYESAQKLPVHAIGSVVWHLSGLWKQVLLQNALLVGKIIQKPFPIWTA